MDHGSPGILRTLALRTVMKINREIIWSVEKKELEKLK